MNKTNMPDDSLLSEDDLGRRLKAQADDLRPEFSESLHARIIESLPASSGQAKRPGIIDISPRWRVLGTAAAALLLIVVLVAWQGIPFGGSNMPSPPSVAESQDADDQDVQLAAIGTLSRADGAELGAMVDRTFAQGQWAYLDHDAKVAAELLTNQLPFQLALSEPQ